MAAPSNLKRLKAKQSLDNLEDEAGQTPKKPKLQQKDKGSPSTSGKKVLKGKDSPPNSAKKLQTPKSAARSRKSEEELKKLTFSQRKKILTSRAYHRTKDQAIRDGTPDEEAKKLARAAASAVAEKLDAENAEAFAEDDAEGDDDADARAEEDDAKGPGAP